MAQKLPTNGYVLGLDVGARRIGVALSSVIARVPRPLAMIPAGDTALNAIQQVIQQESVSLVVIGIPRNLEGSETAQSATIREFADRLAPAITVPIVFADESLSSVRAESLAAESQFKNASSDSLAACFILEEYFATYVHGGDSQS